MSLIQMTPETPPRRKTSIIQPPIYVGQPVVLQAPPPVERTPPSQEPPTPEIEQPNEPDPAPCTYGGRKAAYEYAFKYGLPFCYIVITPAGGADTPTGRAMDYLTSELETRIKTADVDRQPYPEDPEDSFQLSSGGDIAVVLYCDGETANALLRKAYEGLKLPPEEPTPGGEPPKEREPNLVANLTEHVFDDPTPPDHPSLPSKPLPFPVDPARVREAYLSSAGREGLLDLLRKPIE